MPKLYFLYGCVGSAKTMNLLCTTHTYEKQGKRVLIVKPKIDKRFGHDIVKSRTGLEQKANAVIESVNELQTIISKAGKIDVLLADEAQFYSCDVINYFRELSFSFPVMCYGLRTDFQTNLFPGSARLLELADEIREIKSTCQKCEKKSVFNMRHQNGKKVSEGQQISLGCEDQYMQVCAFHYFEKDEKNLKRKRNEIQQPRKSLRNKKFKVIPHQ